MMKKITKTSLCILFISLSIYSCTDTLETVINVKNSSDIQAVNGRLVFKNSAIFQSTVNKINSWDDSKLLNWSKEFKYSPLLSQLDTVNADSISLKRFPNSYQTLLNADGEIVIGDTIIWYSGTGKKHYILNVNESELKMIKAGSLESKLTGDYKISHPKYTTKSNSNDRVFFSGIDARWQKEFYFQNDGGSKRKYVNELYTFWDGNYTELYVRIKLEYWGKKNCCSYTWKPAGEQREIQYTFTYNAYLVWGTIAFYGGYPLTFYGTKSEYYVGNGQRNIFLGSDYLTYSDTNFDWSVEISGTIYQYIINDYSSNAWTCTGYPLW